MTFAFYTLYTFFGRRSLGGGDYTVKEGTTNDRL